MLFAPSNSSGGTSLGSSAERAGSKNTPAAACPTASA
jgi:hypothetical protein